MQNLCITQLTASFAGSWESALGTKHLERVPAAGQQNHTGVDNKS